MAVLGGLGSGRSGGQAVWSWRAAVSAAAKRCVQSVTDSRALRNGSRRVREPTEGSARILSSWLRVHPVILVASSVLMAALTPATAVPHVGARWSMRSLRSCRHGGLAWGPCCCRATAAEGEIGKWFQADGSSGRSAVAVKGLNRLAIIKPLVRSRCARADSVQRIDSPEQSFGVGRLNFRKRTLRFQGMRSFLTWLPARVFRSLAAQVCLVMAGVARTLNGTSTSACSNSISGGGVRTGIWITTAPGSAWAGDRATVGQCHFTLR